MFRLSRIMSLLVVLIISVFCFQSEALSWTNVAETNELFAVGAVNGTEKSYLYKINPVTGELLLLGDTGLNNCTGLDFNPEGKLKAFCEIRGEVDSKTNSIEAGTPVVAELNLDDGAGEWAVSHGVTNNISDITIGEDGRIFSYENLKEDNVHMHEEADDFEAQLIGAPGVEAFDHGLAAWGIADLKLAANVGSTPSLFSVDSETANVKLLGTLSFPDAFGLVTMQEVSTRAAVESIVFLSMDTRRIAGVDLPPTNSTSGAIAGYAFEENDADFAVLLTTSDERVLSDIDARAADGEPWAGIALLDLETLSVDYIVDLDETPVRVDAITLRRLPTRAVPALSTTGVVATGAILLLIGLIYYRRKYGLSL